MYIIDRIEHGNGGVCGFTVLDSLPLKEALKKSPFDYDIRTKMWGFWPVLSSKKNGGNHYTWYWDEDEETWVRYNSYFTKSYKYKD